MKKPGARDPQGWKLSLLQMADQGWADSPESHVPGVSNPCCGIWSLMSQEVAQSFEYSLNSSVSSIYSTSI